MKFFSDMLTSNEKVSSKRVITLIAFLLMATGFISNLFWKLKIEEFIFDSMKWAVIGGLGFTASERFGSKQTPTKNDEN